MYSHEKRIILLSIQIDKYEITQWECKAHQNLTLTSPTSLHDLVYEFFLIGEKHVVRLESHFIKETTKWNVMPILGNFVERVGIFSFLVLIPYNAPLSLYLLHFFLFLQYKRVHVKDFSGVFNLLNKF